MIVKLQLKNFTVFSDAEIKLSQGVNVLVGENGTGKTHLLKLAYVLNGFFESVPSASKEVSERRVADKLVNVFRPDTLGRLATRVPGRTRCDVAAYSSGGGNISFSLSTNSKTKVVMDDSTSFGIAPETSALFIPTKEVLSIYPGFSALYRDRELTFDETYADLCASLDRLPLRGPRLQSVSRLLKPIEDVLGGVIVKEEGKFYFKAPHRGKVEISLFAEGYRKIGLLAYLILNGSLMSKGMLLWDEPESNLNPRLIKEVASFLCEMSSFDIQIVLATHSLFLLREMNIISRERGVPLLYTAFSLDEAGVASVYQTPEFDELPELAALEEETVQGNRYYEIYGDE